VIKNETERRTERDVAQASRRVFCWRLDAAATRGRDDCVISKDELDLTRDEADGQIAHAFRREIC